MRALLLWFEFPDPVSNTHSPPTYPAAKSNAQFVRLVAAWRTCFGKKARTAREAVEASRQHPPLAEILWEIGTDRDGELNIKCLAKWLGKQQGRPADGWTLERAGQREHVMLFRAREVK